LSLLFDFVSIRILIFCVTRLFEVTYWCFAQSKLYNEQIAESRPVEKTRFNARTVRLKTSGHDFVWGRARNANLIIILP